MSMDFRANVKRERTFDYGRSLCPACGGRHRFAPAEVGPEANPDCDTCYGDGADWQADEAARIRESEADGSFNVSNANGFYILQEILGITNPECYGEIDPATVLTRLAVFSPVEQAAGVRAPTVEQGVILTADGVAPGATWIDCGRKTWQIEGYLAKLRRCAEVAQEHGAEIIWG